MSGELVANPSFDHTLIRDGVVGRCDAKQTASPNGTWSTVGSCCAARRLSVTAVFSRGAARLTSNILTRTASQTLALCGHPFSDTIDRGKIRLLALVFAATLSPHRSAGQLDGLNCPITVASGSVTPSFGCVYQRCAACGVPWGCALD